MGELPVSERFKRLAFKTRGKEGAAWADQLPNLMMHCQQTYNVSFLREMEHLSVNYVIDATWKNNQPIIVKFSLPDKCIQYEIEALAFMRGNGMIKLLAADKKKSILLLEKCQPGYMLKTYLDDEQATHIAATVMQNIWKPIPSDTVFPNTKQWFNRLDKAIKLPADFPSKLIQQARSIAAELHQEQGEQVLLHGDLHHFNILAAQRQPWLAIDPKGVIGKREYEVGAFLRNPIPDIAKRHHLKSILARRIDIFSERLGLDKKVITGWGFAQAILSAVWCLDANADDYNMFLICADALTNKGVKC